MGPTVVARLLSAERLNTSAAMSDVDSTDNTAGDLFE